MHVLNSDTYRPAGLQLLIANCLLRGHEPACRTFPRTPLDTVQHGEDVPVKSGVLDGAPELELYHRPRS